MCISAAALTAIGALAGGIGGLYSATQAGKNDPKSAAQVDAEAQRNSNARLAARRKALAANSLATGAGAGGGTADAGGGGVMGGTNRATLG
jgi:hypothetical protein